MVIKLRQILPAIAALALVGHLTANAKPLKVYLLAGQSNMQGKAQIKTIERLKLTGGNQEMYDDIMGNSGKLTAPEGVRIAAFSYGDMSKGESRPLTELSGPLIPGFTEDPGPRQSFGPEYTFGIYMQKHLNEPVLIIKTAWGGRNLLQQFRPPSAGDYSEAKDGHGNETGAYYQLMIQQAKKVLANLGDYHPEYNPSQGYELAGFVWFQGFNDMIMDTTYDPEYSEYTRLLSCLIRDVRKDLEAPKMPVVIGVMGLGGPTEDEQGTQARFRKAQALPATMPEFQGNVAAVHTAPLWDMELIRISDKLDEAVEKKILAEQPKMKSRALKGAVKKLGKQIASEMLEPEEFKIFKDGTSSQGFHYMGSALIFGNIGKAFADAMHELSTQN